MYFTPETSKGNHIYTHVQHTIKLVCLFWCRPLTRSAHINTETGILVGYRFSIEGEADGRVVIASAMGSIQLSPHHPKKWKISKGKLMT